MKTKRIVKTVVSGSEQHKRRLTEYVRQDSSYRQALACLTTAGCDSRILKELASADCDLTGVSGQEMEIELRKFLRVLAKIRTGLPKLVNHLEQENLPYTVMKEWGLFGLCWLEVMDVEQRIRRYLNLPVPSHREVEIALPVLAAYVEQVTGKPHHPEIASLLRAFRYASKAKHQDVDEDAVRKRLANYRDHESWRYKQIEEAVRLYREQPHTHKEQHYLLKFAYFMIGAPVAALVSWNLKQSANSLPKTGS